MGTAEILHVEDEKIIAMEAQIQLEKMGFSVMGSVGSGEEALEVLQTAAPDLILMDIMLDGRLDGIETAEMIKKEKNIPVIFCTAYTDEDTRTRAEAVHPLGFLSKPIDYDTLKELIKTAVQPAEAS